MENPLNVESGNAAKNCQKKCINLSTILASHTQSGRIQGKNRPPNAPARWVTVE